MKRTIIFLVFIFLIEGAQQLLQAQGIRAVTRRTVMAPAPGFFLLPGYEAVPPAAPGQPMAAPLGAPAGGFGPGTAGIPQVRVAQASEDPSAVDARVLAFHRKRAVEGSAYAQFALGVRYLEGNGVEKDEAQARYWLSQSAQKGFRQAARVLQNQNW
jgi:hypothetical protein